MRKFIISSLAVFGLVAAPLFAGQQHGQKLSDRELDQVKGGAVTWLGWDPVFSIQPVLPPASATLNVQITVPPNAVSVIQKNVGGTATFTGSAIGQQTNWFTPGG